MCHEWKISLIVLTKILLVGNIEPSEAKSIAQEIEDTIFSTPNTMFKSMSPSQYLTKRVIMLENELKCYYQIEGLNQKNENSSVIQYIQVSYVVPCCRAVCFVDWTCLVQAAPRAQASDFGRLGLDEAA